MATSVKISGVNVRHEGHVWTVFVFSCNGVGMPGLRLRLMDRASGRQPILTSFLMSLLRVRHQVQRHASRVVAFNCFVFDVIELVFVHVEKPAFIAMLAEVASLSDLLQTSVRSKHLHGLLNFFCRYSS